MKIRDKLFLGFGLYIFLAAVLGLFAFKELRTIGRGLALVEVADDITNNVLEVRRYEKNFLLYRDTGNLQELMEYLALLKVNISNIKQEIVSEMGSEHYDFIKRFLGRYEGLVDALAKNFQAQEEIAALIRTLGRNAERSLGGGDLEAFLVLRRLEKNVMLEKDEKAYNAFRKSVTASRLDRHSRVQQYVSRMDILSSFYRSEREIVESMRKTAREVQGITGNLAQEERKNIETTLKAAFVLLFAGLAFIIAVGIFINGRLARSIVTPILDLERITKKIARGDFSESIQVKGKDEIAELAVSFNLMEQKLDQAMSALDAIIKKLQEKQSQLVEAEKLASLGKLAAGIAHEINNPLTSVLTFSNLMLEQCPASDPRHGKLKMMARETERARNIVRQLLNFGRESVIKPVKININQPVTEITESLVAQEAFKGIELSMKLAEDLPAVYADPAQLGQVVLNILLNAIHAIVPPGRISVETRRSDASVEIVFSDTGKGIPEEHLHKIFDPFFTTKDATKGTGLGLAVSYGIIKKHGGEIDAESTVGTGTTFTVRLPVYG
jgi:two-component system NtrC family sensor kinase